MKTIIFAIFVAIGLATPAMAQDHRGTFAPGTKCLDGSAPKHLGQIQKADGKMYDRWGCNDASSPGRTNPGPSAPRAVVAAPTTNVGPEASADYLATQRASDAAALAAAKPAAPRVLAAPTSGIGILRGSARPTKDSDGDELWVRFVTNEIIAGRSKFKDRAAFMVALQVWGTAWGVRIPPAADLESWLLRAGTYNCDAEFLRNSVAMGTHDGTKPVRQTLSGCGATKYYIGYAASDGSIKPLFLATPALPFIMPAPPKEDAWK